MAITVTISQVEGCQSGEFLHFRNVLWQKKKEIKESNTPFITWTRFINLQ